VEEAGENEEETEHMEETPDEPVESVGDRWPSDSGPALGCGCGCEWDCVWDCVLDCRPAVCASAACCCCCCCPLRRCLGPACLAPASARSAGSPVALLRFWFACWPEVRLAPGLLLGAPLDELVGPLLGPTGELPALLEASLPPCWIAAMSGDSPS